MKSNFKKFFIIGMIVPFFIIFIGISIFISYKIYDYNLNKSSDIKKSDEVIQKDIFIDTLNVSKPIIDTNSNSSVTLKKIENSVNINKLKNKINFPVDSTSIIDIGISDTIKPDTISPGLNLNDTLN